MRIEESFLTLARRIAEWCGRLPLSNTTRQKWLGNMFWLYALQGLNYLVPLAVLPYLVRTLGVERYGLIAFAQAFAQYFVILTDYGFNLSATKRIALAREDQVEVARIYWSVIFVKFGLMFLSAMVAGGMVLTIPRFRADAVLYAIAYIGVLGSVLFPVWIFQGMEQMRYISVVNGAAKLLAALLLFVLVHQRTDYVIALAIQSGGLLFAGIAGFWIGVVHFKLSYQRPSKTQLALVMRDGWHLFVSNAAGTLYATTNVFLVGLVAGNVQAGYFSAAERITRSIQGMLGPITQAIYPHVSGLAAKSREIALAFIRKSLAWVGLLSFLPSLLLLLFARPIALILFGKAAEGSITPLRWMAMLPFVIAVSSVLAIQTMIPFGMEKQLSRIYVVAGLGGLSFSLPLIYHFGASGGGAGVLTIETGIVLAMWNTLKRHGVDLGRRLHLETQDNISVESEAKVSENVFWC
jgi:polysaccharide transporter, PST family